MAYLSSILVFYVVVISSPLGLGRGIMNDPIDDVIGELNNLLLGGSSAVDKTGSEIGTSIVKLGNVTSLLSGLASGLMIGVNASESLTAEIEAVVGAILQSTNRLFETGSKIVKSGTDIYGASLEESLPILSDLLEILPEILEGGLDSEPGFGNATVGLENFVETFGNATDSFGGELSGTLAELISTTEELTNLLTGDANKELRMSVTGGVLNVTGNVAKATSSIVRHFSGSANDLTGIFLAQETSIVEQFANLLSGLISQGINVGLGTLANPLGALNATISDKDAASKTHR